jgi:molybdopterin biosynthesis enzyme
MEAHLTMWGFWQALEIVLREAVAARREPERVELARAAGLVLAGDARATMALPPFPASIMDGYAVVASVHSSLSPLLLHAFAHG